jgi:hypothetical protein
MNQNSGAGVDILSNNPATQPTTQPSDSTITEPSDEWKEISPGFKMKVKDFEDAHFSPEFLNFVNEVVTAVQEKMQQGMTFQAALEAVLREKWLSSIKYRNEIIRLIQLLNSSATYNGQPFITNEMIQDLKQRGFL